ncbi:Ssp2p [Kluyveromyces lactis]|uniref:KLLA0F11275p n=1 Tax=Kluyveromyces lactis (strain ATCC 8585 / CBS 2359 / DSM 70799 / NBRC 1267 / NRRL Y-1140 / WM37) TaxID=284590 RepID=Q6CKE6_KLULA|nr:uncharacterized protein KLLA0_F11275g [Kluyveromyces lactis]CAG98301.1 KLLA0F11275p [Kluyveromyces lactis]|eukprot:XP_455593.1 uncharacterized protein KLLA0_F11275g [Kluyveromyces lactis]
MISEGSFLDPQIEATLYGQKKASNLGTFQTNSTASKTSSLNRELFGFRRKARQYFETTTQRFREHGNDKELMRAGVNYKPRSEDEEMEELNKSKLMMDMLFEKANHGSKQDFDKLGGTGKYGVHISSTPKSVPELLCEAVYQDVHGEISLASPESESIDISNSAGRRVVIFQDLLKNIGVGTLLAQVSGGPLEKVLYAYDNKTGSRDVVYVELHFLFPDDAAQFMKYARFHLFKVNGVHLVPHWGVIDSLDSSEKSLLDIQQYVHPDFCKDIQNFDSTGARRCLIMKKYSRKHKSISTELNSKSHIYDLDIQQIIDDFNQFGQVLEVSPLISRKICLQISFHDIRSAIEAMRSYETSNSYINGKYFKDWSIWYGKDIVDKPCIEV